MITSLFIVCIIHCFVLIAKLRLISHNRLDAFGIRVELVSWLMFLVLTYSKEELLKEPISILFLMVICGSRIISCSSVILGHPHKETTFTIGKRATIRK